MYQNAEDKEKTQKDKSEIIYQNYISKIKHRHFLKHQLKNNLNLDKDTKIPLPYSIHIKVT